MLVNRQFLKSIGAMLGVLVVAGCGSAQKTMPHMQMTHLSVEAQIDREDLVVLDSVEGTSTTQTILWPLLQIIDGDKVKLFGIPFFKEKYTYFSEPGLLGLNPLASTADRAYYKALEKAPDADAVFLKSMDHEDEGLPLLWHTKSVTWRGKAIQLKADQ